MSFKHEILRHGDELYKVLRKIRESHKPIIETWKQHLRAEKVFRNDGFLIFCALIPDAVIVEDKIEPSMLAGPRGPQSSVPETNTIITN